MPNTPIYKEAAMKIARDESKLHALRWLHTNHAYGRTLTQVKDELQAWFERVLNIYKNMQH